jgi:hypothetical protein
MSKLESIKADLSLHEKILFAAVAIMITLVGWTAANYLVVIYGVVGNGGYQCFYCLPVPNYQKID